MLTTDIGKRIELVSMDPHCLNISIALYLQDHGQGPEFLVHSYRHRLGTAPGYAPYEEVERRLAALPPISVPTITLDGKADGIVAASDGKSSAPRFTGSLSHRVIDKAGHNLPEEAPKEFTDAVWELASRES